MASLPTRAQVLETLFQRWQPIYETETFPVQAALGRVLAQDQYAQVAIPVARASAMDGVAVCSARFQQSTPDAGSWKLGVDFCRADTGDDFDDRFDPVLPIEQVKISAEGQLTISENIAVRSGDNVRPRGSTIRVGELMAMRHRQLRPSDWPVWPWAALHRWRFTGRLGWPFYLQAASWYPWAHRWAGARTSIATASWPRPC